MILSIASFNNKYPNFILISHIWGRILSIIKTAASIIKNKEAAPQRREAELMTHQVLTISMVRVIKDLRVKRFT